MEENEATTPTDEHIVVDPIETAIAKFDPYVAKIDTAREEYAKLMIADHDDKAGFDIVHKARMDVKNTRIAIQKQRKDLADPALAYQKALKAREDDLVELLKPIEGQLQEKEDVYTAEKERLRKEEEIRIEARTAERIKMLVDNRLDFDGFKYTIEDVNITVDEVKTFSDRNFSSFMDTRVMPAYKVSIAKEAEEKRIADKRETDRLTAAESQNKEMELMKLENTRIKELAQYGYAYPADDLADLTQEEYAKIALDAKKEFEAKNPPEQKESTIDESQAEHKEGQSAVQGKSEKGPPVAPEVNRPEDAGPEHNVYHHTSVNINIIDGEYLVKINIGGNQYQEHWDVDKNERVRSFEQEKVIPPELRKAIDAMGIGSICKAIHKIDGDMPF